MQVCNGNLHFWAEMVILGKTVSFKPKAFYYCLLALSRDHGSWKTIHSSVEPKIKYLILSPLSSHYCFLKTNILKSLLNPQPTCTCFPGELVLWKRFGLVSVSAVLCRLSMIWMHCGQGSFTSVTCEVHSRKVQWKSPPAPASHSVLQVQLCAQLPGQLGWGTDVGKNKPAKESGFVR